MRGAAIGWRTTERASPGFSDIRERGFLPLIAREVPIACTRFVIVSAGAISHGRVAPVVHSNLQQCARRKSGADHYRTAFKMTGRKRCPRRRSPEMPDLLGELPHAQNYHAVIFGICEWNRKVRIGAEPGTTEVKASANIAAIIIQDNIFPIDFAGQLRPRNFNLRFLESMHASVSHCDSPQHCGIEIRRFGDRVNVARFEAHFRRKARFRLGKTQSAEQKD